MGKQIYLTDKEIEWLKDKLGSLSEMELYWEGGKEKELLDSVYEKIDG